MDISFEDFLAAYHKAPPHIKQAIDSEAVGVFVEEKFSTLEEPLNKGSLILLVGNCLLELINETEILETLSTLVSKEKAPILAQEIAAFVFSIKSQAGKTDGLNIEKDIAETEAALSSLPTIRTMGDDVAN